MGYMRHHGMLVTGFRREDADTAYQAALGFGLSATPPIESVVNGYWSFAILPDGSKEGWPESESGDKKRSGFREYLHSVEYEDGSSPLDWIEVWYGDDDGYTSIVEDSDTRRRLQDERTHD